MAWTTPITWTVGQVVGASDLNTNVRDNINFLLSGKALGGDNGQVSNWTLQNPAATYVDVFSVTISISSGRIGLFSEGYLSLNNVASRWGQITYTVDGTDQGDATYGYLRIPTNSNRYFSYFLIFPGLSAGSHIVKMQMKISNNDVTLSLGENTSNNQRMTVFRVWEF